MFKKKTKSQTAFEPAPSSTEKISTGLDWQEEDKGEEPAPASSLAEESTTLETEDDGMHDSDLTAAISRNTLVKGNITTDDNLEIFGSVEGTISCNAVTKIYGRVEGDITCSILIANNADIFGDILCENSAVLGNNTRVTGNVSAQVITINGRIDGDIHAAESVQVSGSGAVYGDISTSVIEVSKGAVISGAVKVIPPVCTESESPSIPTSIPTPTPAAKVPEPPQDMTPLFAEVSPIELS